jgi:predicted nucleic acid-binding protein
MKHMSGDRVFFDTNILLYAEDGRDMRKRRIANDCIEAAWKDQLARCSWQVLHEFYLNASRKLGLQQAAARTLVRYYEVWDPLETNGAVVERAWFWMDQAQVSYWDGLVLGAAEQLECSVLLSEDFQAGRRYGGVLVVNPFAEDTKVTPIR